MSAESNTGNTPLVPERNPTPRAGDTGAPGIRDAAGEIAQTSIYKSESKTPSATPPRAGERETRARPATPMASYASLFGFLCSRHVPRR